MRPRLWLLVTQLLMCVALAATAALYVHYLDPADSDFCGLRSGCESVRRSPLSRFFGSGPLSLPLWGLLAQLALYGFSISICKHFSAKDTLRIIRDEWGLQAKIHPGLIGSGWVRGFMTSESCKECEEEWEREYEENREKYERLARECADDSDWQGKAEGLFDTDGDVPF